MKMRRNVAIQVLSSVCAYDLSLLDRALLLRLRSVVQEDFSRQFRLSKSELTYRRCKIPQRFIGTHPSTTWWHFQTIQKCVHIGIRNIPIQMTERMIPKCRFIGIYCIIRSEFILIGPYRLDSRSHSTLPSARPVISTELFFGSTVSKYFSVTIVFSPNSVGVVMSAIVLSTWLQKVAEIRGYPEPDQRCETRG